MQRKYFVSYLLPSVALHINNNNNHLFYGHYTGQPALVSTSVKNWWILLVQSFTACMPLLEEICNLSLETLFS